VSQNVSDLVNTLFPLPDPTTSEEQGDRFANRDVVHETEDVLRRELSVLHIINYISDDPWYREREQAIANELGYRRSRRRLERPRHERAS